MVTSGCRLSTPLHVDCLHPHRISPATRVPMVSSGQFLACKDLAWPSRVSSLHSCDRLRDAPSPNRTACPAFQHPYPHPKTRFALSIPVQSVLELVPGG